MNQNRTTRRHLLKTTVGLATTTLLTTTSRAASDDYQMTKHTIDGAREDPDAITRVDITGNGVDDLVVGDGTDGTVYYYTRDSWTRHTVAGGFGDIEGIAAGDIDADGRVEIVVCDQKHGHITLLRQGKHGWKKTVLDRDAPQCQNAHLWSLTDTDGLDIVYTYEGYPNGSGGLAFLEWTLTGWRKHLVYKQPGAYQFTRDPENYRIGRGIVLAARNPDTPQEGDAGGLHILAPGDDPRDPWHSDSYYRGEKYTHVSTMDATGDGDRRDVIARSGHNIDVCRYRDGGFSRRRLLDGSASSERGYRNVVAGDITTSRRDDVVVANKPRETLQLYVYDESRSGWVRRAEIDQKKSDDTLLLWDVDRDGWLEVVSCEAAGGSVYYADITRD